MGGYSVRDEAEIEENFKATKYTNGNTICLAIFWESTGAREGKFDFSSIDTVIKIARRYELRLIFLWFASSKNGVMDYAPAWMKSKPEIYKRATAKKTATKLWVLSTQCKASLEADKKAFTALCAYLKKQTARNKLLLDYRLRMNREYSAATGITAGSSSRI